MPSCPGHLNMPRAPLDPAQLARRQAEIAQLFQDGRIEEASRAAVALMDQLLAHQRHLHSQAEALVGHSRLLIREKPRHGRPANAAGDGPAPFARGAAAGRVSCSPP